MRIEEFLNVTFDESLPKPKSSSLVEDDRIIEPVVQNLVRSQSLEANASELGYPKNLKEARVSACWVWRPTKLNSASITLKRHNYGHPQKEDQGYIDSGCSRHMTRNMPYLSDFKDFDGGYVTIGRGAKGGKITGKGTLKTVFVFTNTGCFVLSPDFKLADESQVLLKVPRKNNMYSVDMNNVVPKESLTCIVAKATLDESMLWHRRLGHFKNRVMSEFCEKKGIKKEFSVARTPQQNGVAERRNRTLIEVARTIGRTLALSFMRPFGCHVTIPNTLDYLGKFDGKSDEGFFVGYSLNSKAFRVYNIRTRKVEENLHIRFLEDKPIIEGVDGPKWLFELMKKVLVQNASNDEPQPPSDTRKKDDEGVCKERGIDDQERPENSYSRCYSAGPIGSMSNITTTKLVPSTPNTRIHKDHSLDHVIGDVQSGVQTRRMTKTTNEQGFISVVYEGKLMKTFILVCLLVSFLPSFEEYTPPVTGPEEVEETLGTPVEVESLDETQLEDLGLNTCNHDIPLSNRETPSFDEPEP
ncbi:putative ribonuclease H-like domain-containing protein [Tanacetum coccineum]